MGSEKYKRKSSNLVDLCTNFQELAGVWEIHQILSSNIVGWGGGTVGKRVAKFRKNGVGEPLQLATGE